METPSFSILGRVTVRLRAGEEPFVPGDAKLLARLLVEPRTTLSMRRLLEDVWDAPDEDERLRGRLHQAVRRLRKSLDDAGGEIIVSTAGGYRLDVPATAIDADRFRSLARHGQELVGQRPRAALALLQEALAAWDGPPLDELAGAAWVAPHAAELVALRNAAEAARNEAWLTLGRYEELEIALARQLEEQPHDERRHLQRIKMLEAADRVAEASAAYRDAVIAVGAPGEALRRYGDGIGRHGRSEMMAKRIRYDEDAPRSGRLLLHAVLSGERAPGTPGQGTLIWLVDREGGIGRPAGADRVAATFPDAATAARAARAIAGDPLLRGAVGIHAGSTVEDGERLHGAAPQRCRLLADAAYPGQVLVSERARLLHWPRSDRLRDVGEQRFADLLVAEPVFELAGLSDPGMLRPPESLSRHPNNLPVQTMPFVGRDRELRELAGRIAPGELLTLTGPGGAGKSRLALQLAAAEVSAFDDGVWFAGFAELPEGSGVEALALTIVTCLGAQRLPDEAEAATEILYRYMSSRSMLLVVDNCEHVLPACRELIAGLRARAPRACVVATSIQPLGLDGEQRHVVGSMAIEVDDADGERELPDAVALFLDRAGATHGRVVDDPTQRSAAFRICRALQGLPMLLELAAGRAAQRGLLALAAEIEQMIAEDREVDLGENTDPTRSPRQRTIDATIRWSYRLLDADQRDVLHRLAVFRGSFGRREAEQVIAGGRSPAVAGAILESLVECSMVAVEPPVAQRSRLSLVLPIRWFALRELKAAGALEETSRRHVDVYCALAIGTAPELFGPGEQIALAQLAADHDNLRAALERLIVEGRSYEALRVTGALWWFWFSHGHFEEGGRWVERTLALSDVPSRERVRALRAGSHLSWWAGDSALTEHYNNELERCAEAIGDAWGIAWAKMGHGAASMFHDPLRAVPLLEESRDRYRDQRRTWEAGYAQQMIGASYWYAGDEAAALPLYDDAVEAFERIGHQSVLASMRRGAGLMAARCGRREHGAALCHQALAFTEATGDRVGSAQALNFLASIARDEGKLDLAAWRHADALQHAWEVGEPWAMCAALDGIASVACAEREPALAARLVARSDALAKRARYRRSAHEQRQREADDEALLADLGPGVLAGELAAGATMEVNEAVTSALAFVRRLTERPAHAPV